MNRFSPAGATLFIGLAFFASPCSGQVQPREAAGRDRNLTVFDAQGRVRGATVLSAEKASAPQAAAVTCNPPRDVEGYVARESRGHGVVVDPCGGIRRDPGRSPAHEDERRTGDVAAAVAPATIDRMTTRGSYGSYTPGGTITLLGSADTYQLSNGRQWQSGAGGYVSHWSMYVGVDVTGTTIRYALSYPVVGLLYEQTDYDAGVHSAQGKLGYSAPLVLEAQAGSTTAVLRGNAVVVSNDSTGYGDPRFNYYSAVVGSVVPFEITYTIQGDTWTADTFSSSFSFSESGWVDFAHPISAPRAVEFVISGPPRVPAESETSYVATVKYENGIRRDVTWKSGWTVDPPGFASVNAGVLTTGTLPGPRQDLTLRASYSEGADTLSAEKVVPCLASDPAEKPDSWPMFQANARHTGYLPITINPTAFRLKWQRNVGSGAALNPVAAGEGKVFVTLLTYFADVPSLFALRASDGVTLWSKGFGSVFSVNPPSYAYGIAYVQTGNHANDTWLHAFEGSTGATVFKAPHAAQWERYFAPTLYDHKVYVDGGYYGGMYGFDAYSGGQLWFTDLPQYDQWTPAVDGGRAFAYVGEYTPGLYTKDSLTGAPVPYFVPDPNFEWNGWSMNLAPVVGAHDDVIAIHDGRLISFDISVGSIRWEIQSQFTGQPSVAGDRIYAVNGGRLVVLDELTHTELWSWRAPVGDLVGPMIVTDSHLLVSTTGAVHAVDLITQDSVWSYPVGGQLALADGTLYVASTDGTLTAIAGPSPTRFYTVTPCRVLDTRNSNGPLGGPSLQPGATRTFSMQAASCGIPVTARSISGNITVTNGASAGFLTAWPADDVQPLVSSINFMPGQTRANNLVLPLSTDGTGSIKVFTGSLGTVDLILDVNGYFK